jgi:hypothetical protein
LFIANSVSQKVLLAKWLSSARDELSKAGKGAVKGFFNIIGEAAGGQFIKLQVVGNALTALALSGAWFIGTVADCLVIFNLTFHLNHLLIGSAFSSLGIA